MNQDCSEDGEKSEIREMDRVSEELVAETSQHIPFDENLFDENLDEDLDFPQPVIKEMYEPAAPIVENTQMPSQGLNWDAKEFIPRDSPTPRGVRYAKS